METAVKTQWITVEQLGQTKPCECGQVMGLGILGQRMTPNGPRLVAQWSCFACGRDEQAGYVWAIPA